MHSFPSRVQCTEFAYDFELVWFIFTAVYCYCEKLCGRLLKRFYVVASYRVSLVQ